MDEYFRIIEELYTSGARNFVLLNVPAINRSPLTIGQGQQAIDLETQALAIYNKKVEQRVKALKNTHKDVWAQVFNSKKVFDKILDKPKSYGLKNTTSYCDSYAKYAPHLFSRLMFYISRQKYNFADQGLLNNSGTPAQDTFYTECLVPVNQYFWLNSLHPTYPVHKAVAQELAKTL